MKILCLKHISFEGPGTFALWAQARGHELEVVAAYQNKPLPSPETFDALLVMGGPMNVYQDEKYPFLKDEDGLLREVIKKRILFLGICLGAQLLAKAQGAKIKKGICKELGWFKVSLTDKGLKDPLLSGMKRELNVFQWHEDEFELPRVGELIVEGDFCRNQAFRIGDYAWGLQFHIEATIDMVEKWMKKDLDSDDILKREAAAKIIKDTFRQSSQFRAQANEIFSNFYQIILKRRF